MTHAEWEEIYRAAWSIYYTPQHLDCIMRRAGATGINLSSLAGTLLHFSEFTAMENVHPLQGGILRLKFRRDRRATFAIEPVWTFYPNYLWGTACKLVRAARVARRLYGLAKTIKADSRKSAYMDQALTPAVEEDLDSLELFNQNDAARNATLHERRVRALTGVAAK
jgi:hypothetical protein